LSRKKETTIQSNTKFEIIDLMQITDEGDFGQHNNVWLARTKTVILLCRGI
jgi:hypothetical protein